MSTLPLWARYSLYAFGALLFLLWVAFIIGVVCAICVTLY